MTHSGLALTLMSNMQSMSNAYDILRRPAEEVLLVLVPDL